MGGENFESPGAPENDPFLQRFDRKSSIWGSKVQVFEGQLSGRAPLAPSSVRYVFGSAKPDPVRFKWGFGEGLLKDTFAFSRLIKILYLRGENYLQNAHFYKQKGPCLKRPLNWTGSVFPLLINLFVLTKGWFPKGWFRRMFPRNENRNEGTFAKTTLVRNRPFISQ